MFHNFMFLATTVPLIIYQSASTRDQYFPKNNCCFHICTVLQNEYQRRCHATFLNITNTRHNQLSHQLSIYYIQYGNCTCNDVSPFTVSRTDTRLRYQLGVRPALLCQICTFQMRPRFSGNLQRQTVCHV